MQLKHTRDKSRGLAAVIQARIRRCRVFGIPDRIVHPRAGEERQGVCGNVSRETIPFSANVSCGTILGLLRQTDRRTSHSASSLSF